MTSLRLFQILIHYLFTTCSHLVQDLFTLVQNFFTTCLQLVPELFKTCWKTCSQLVHDFSKNWICWLFFMTCSWHLFITSSRHVHNLFMTFSWLVHNFSQFFQNLFMSRSQLVKMFLKIFLLLQKEVVQVVDLFTTCSLTCLWLVHDLFITLS